MAHLNRERSGDEIQSGDAFGGSGPREPYVEQLTRWWWQPSEARFDRFDRA
jgi:hypothetical protein